MKLTNTIINMKNKEREELINNFEIEYRSRLLSQIQNIEDECFESISEFFGYGIDDDDVIEIHSEFNSKNVINKK